MKIDSVKVKNFKSLKDIDIKLNNLTLITGVNSSGKSSFIQSLLLFKENLNNICFSENFRKHLLAKDHNKLNDKMSYGIFDIFGFGDNKTPYSIRDILGIVDNEIIQQMSFNGDYINAGDPKMLLSQESFGDSMIFEILNNEHKFNISINEQLELKHDKDSDNKILEIFNDSTFDYLATNRTPPKNMFAFSQKDIDSNSIGINGEYTPHYLAEHRHQSLSIEELKHPASQTLQLLENTYKWLGEISSGVLISASSDALTQSVKLTYQYEYGDNTTSNYSSLNVGFGLTYVLPVIVLILKSKPGDFIIIENPESHLHPAGQSKIAEMCAIAANNGVQIIVETHSDHFLNGVRVATKNKIITPEKSQIYFFEKEKNGLNTIPRSINIDVDGKLSDWPKSFFDEWDNQLDKLLW